MARECSPFYPNTQQISCVPGAKSFADGFALCQLTAEATLKIRLAVVWAGGRLYNLGLAGVRNGNPGFDSWLDEMSVIPATLEADLAGSDRDAVQREKTSG